MCGKERHWSSCNITARCMADTPLQLMRIQVARLKVGWTLDEYFMESSYIDEKIGKQYVGKAASARLLMDVIDDFQFDDADKLLRCALPIARQIAFLESLPRSCLQFSRLVSANQQSQPPEIAPTIMNSSRPSATAAGNGLSRPSCDMSRWHAKKRRRGRRLPV